MDKKLEKISERLAKWYPEHKVYAMDSIDQTLRESCAAYAKEHDTTVEELLKSLGYEMISGDEVYALRGPAKYAPGEEPEVIRSKIDSVLKRLEEAYPDRKIAGSIMNQHKNLAKDISGVYQWLGYKSNMDFLAAYSYEYSEGAPGRRKSVDPEAIVKALQEKYPNGSPFYTTNELFAGTEYESKLKTIINTSKAVFGMPFTKYLQSIGLLQSKTVSGKTAEEIAGECNEFLAELKRRYPEGSWYFSLQNLLAENGDLQAKYNEIKTSWSKVFGENISKTLEKEGILCSEETASRQWERAVAAITAAKGNDFIKSLTKLAALVNGLNTAVLNSMSQMLFHVSAVEKLTEMGLLGGPDSLPITRLLPEEVELKPGAYFPMGKDCTWWRILDIDTEAMTALVIAQDAVRQKAYHKTCEDVTWENCTLRAWLNGEYFKDTFFPEEQNAILETVVKNPDNKEYHTPGGNDTEDRIYLLNNDEAERYFENDEDRTTGEYWWTRTPGLDCQRVAEVTNDGKVGTWGYPVDRRSAVRPVLRIDLKSEFFKSFISPGNSQKTKICVPKLCARGPIIYDTSPNVVDVVIPEGITELNQACFMNRKQLRSVTLPTTMERVGKYAFAGCSNLQKIIVQSNISEWGNYALYQCGRLEYTPEMFRTTAKLDEVFMRHLKNVGPEELAYLYLYQTSGDKWRGVRNIRDWNSDWKDSLERKVTTTNADKILTAMAEHIFESVTLDEEVAKAAAEFTVEHIRWLRAKTIDILCDAMRSKSCGKVADELRTNPMVAPLFDVSVCSSIAYKTHKIALPRKKAHSEIKTSVSKNKYNYTSYGTAVFRGFRSQIEEAVEYIETATGRRYHIYETDIPDIYEFYPDNELSGVDGGVVDRLLKKFPCLKMAAFYDNGYANAYVVFSEPGYDYPTAVEYAGEFDWKSDSVFVYCENPTASYKESGYTVQTGDWYETDYSFPFEEEWNRFDYLIPDGNGFAAVTSVRLPYTVRELKDYAYSYSKDLEEVILPKTLTKISPKAFFENKKLKRIVYEDGSRVKL